MDIEAVPETAAGLAPEPRTARDAKNVIKRDSQLSTNVGPQLSGFQTPENFFFNYWRYLHAAHRLEIVGLLTSKTLAMFICV
jgi:hypothetical protein